MGVDIFEALGIVKRVVITNEDGDILKIDATTNENHSAQAQLTEFPIEDGESVSDYVIKKGRRLSITGIISDDPIELVSGVSRVADMVANSGRPSKTAFDILMTAYEERQLLSIVTSLDEYSDMIMTNFTCPRDTSTAHALRFTAEFKQALFASTETVEIPDDATKDKATSVKDKGKKGATETKAGTQSKINGQKSSILYDTLG